MREWRVGRITLGILFLAGGVILLLRLFTEINFSPIIKFGIPIILILLGLEVLTFSLFAKGKVKVSIASIVLILLFLAVALGFSLMFDYVQFPYFDRFHEIVNSGEKSVDNTLRFKVNLNENIMLPAGTNKISVDITNGSLEIVGTQTDRVTLTGTVTVSAANQQAAELDVAQNLTAKINGDELQIAYSKETGKVSIGFLTMTAPILNLNVPNEMMADIDLVNGNITIENIQGKLDLDLVNGRVDVKLDRLASDIQAQTVNGRINLLLPADSNALIAAKVNVGSIGGNINWVDVASSNQFVGAEKNAKIGSGSYNINLKTVTGSIEVDAPEHKRR